MSDVLARLGEALAGRYRVERELGAGGMATVYLAHDLKHDRKVAIKVLKPELAAVLGAERFLSEIKVTANLQHPNLLPLFDSGEADGLLYYVMPYVEGETLRARVERERQLPVDETRSPGVAHGGRAGFRARARRDPSRPQAGEHPAAGGAAGDRRLRHRAGRAHAGGERITQTGVSLGTPHYMSPEQARATTWWTRAATTTALAAMTYEMLTGEPPHTGATAQAIIARLMTETPRSITSARPSVPKGIDAAVQRALSKTPPTAFPRAATSRARSHRGWRRSRRSGDRGRR